jgi:hypothetical protein
MSNSNSFSLGSADWRTLPYLFRVFVPRAQLAHR